MDYIYIFLSVLALCITVLAYIGFRAKKIEKEIIEQMTKPKPNRKERRKMQRQHDKSRS